MKLNANMIEGLLRNRHESDVFVPECKIGSTWMERNCLRLDAWTMKKSWANPACIGYEIKVVKQLKVT